MSATTASVTLLVASLCFGFVAVERWRSATPAQPMSASSMVQLRESASALSDDSLSAAAGVIAARDRFRLSNRTPTARYDPNLDAGPGSPSALGVAAAPVRPSLVLKAIVGGPPWQAVIDGLPGNSSASMAQVGSRFDKLVVRAVTRDSVIIQGPDTTWVLSFRRRS